MRLIGLAVILTLGILLAPLAVEAQQAAKIARIDRSAEGKPERLTALVAELVALEIDVIVTAGGTPPALAAKQATRTIPIVFASAHDPVTDGLVTSLARPGGNVTGLSNLAPELVGKRQLKQAVPGVSPLAARWPGRTHGKGHAEESRSRGTGAGGCGLNSLRREVPPISTGPSRK